MNDDALKPLEFSMRPTNGKAGVFVEVEVVDQLPLGWGNNPVVRGWLTVDQVESIVRTLVFMRQITMDENR